MRQLSGANEATATKFALHFKCTKIETKKCQLQMDKCKQKKGINFNQIAKPSGSKAKNR